MNISDLVGAVLQSGIASSSNERMRNALGGLQILTVHRFFK